ncbi:MAG: hypothetical protein O3C21_19550 [Verrucomicrobia bacterium]|nr:hypothetical protein [Verrucomicrobiota bacterium]
MKYSTGANFGRATYRLIHWIRMVASFVGLAGISLSASAQDEGYFPDNYVKVDRSLAFLNEALPDFTFDNTDIAMSGQAVFDYLKNDQDRQAVSIILNYVRKYDSKILRAEFVGWPITDWERPDKDVGDADSWTWTQKADKTTPSITLFKRGPFWVRLQVGRGIDELTTARAIDGALEGALGNGVDWVMAQIKKLEGSRVRPNSIPDPPKPNVSAPAFVEAITPEGWMLTGCAALDTSSAPDPECHLLSCGWIREEDTPDSASVDRNSSGIGIRLEIHVRSKEERETGVLSIGGGIVDHDLRHPYPRVDQPQIDEGRFRPDA